MRIKIKVHTNSSQQKIERRKENIYEVWLKEKPINNKANEKLIKILREYLKRQVKIISGLKSKNKTIELKK